MYILFYLSSEYQVIKSPDMLTVWLTNHYWAATGMEEWSNCIGTGLWRVDCTTVQYWTKNSWLVARLCKREISAQWEYNKHRGVCIIMLSRLFIQIKMQVGATLKSPSRPRATKGFFKWTSDSGPGDAKGTGFCQVSHSNSK